MSGPSTTAVTGTTTDDEKASEMVTVSGRLKLSSGSPRGRMKLLRAVGSLPVASTSTEHAAAMHALFGEAASHWNILFCSYLL